MSEVLGTYLSLSVCVCIYIYAHIHSNSIFSLSLSLSLLGTLVVNPGQLSKGKNGGTYADLHIWPLKEDTLRQAVLDNKEEVQHEVSKRVSAKKINI